MKYWLLLVAFPGVAAAESQILPPFPGPPDYSECLEVGSAARITANFDMPQEPVTGWHSFVVRVEFEGRDGPADSEVRVNCSAPLTADIRSRWRNEYRGTATGFDETAQVTVSGDTESVVRVCFELYDEPPQPGTDTGVPTANLFDGSLECDMGVGPDTGFEGDTPYARTPVGCTMTSVPPVVLLVLAFPLVIRTRRS